MIGQIHCGRYIYKKVAKNINRMTVAAVLKDIFFASIYLLMATKTFTLSYPARSTSLYSSCILHCQFQVA